MDQSIPQWYDENFPPLAIYHGGRDFLVATDPLLERIEKHEPTVKLVRVQGLAESEVRSSVFGVKHSSALLLYLIALRFLSGW